MKLGEGRRHGAQSGKRSAQFGFGQASSGAAMKPLRISAMVAVLAVLAMFALHGNGLAQGSNLRILTPTQGAQLAVDAVQVSYELVNTGVSSDPAPTFQLQLDGQDPVQTTANDYTFTGLAPGKHVITVELVDANSLPIAGSAGAIQFTVTAGQTKPQSGLQEPNGRQTASPQLGGESGRRLPEAASPLPLVSIIGFGVLLGGIISAMRTR